MKGKNIMKSFISSLLSFLALMLFASTDNDSIDQHFNEKNKKTAWAQLKEVIAYVDAQPLVAEPEIQDIESLAVYIKTHEVAIEKLYAAARMPCVDFSCYINTTVPRIIDFTTKIRGLRVLGHDAQVADVELSVWSQSRENRRGIQFIACCITNRFTAQGKSIYLLSITKSGLY